MGADKLKEIVRKVVEEVLNGADPPSTESPPVLEERITRESPGKRFMTVSLGADHGGYQLKEKLKRFLVEDMNCSVIDCGTYGTDPVDYPDIAIEVAKKVAEGKCVRGIMIDAAGIGSSVAANKIKGVRAAVCHDLFTATTSREHTNSNVLTLGSKVLNPGLARQIVRVWLKTEFSGGRHEERLEKIRNLEESPG